MTSDELQRLIDDRQYRSQVSAVRLVEACLERAQQLQHDLNAFYCLCPAAALADAERVDQERTQERRLPLDGMPLGIKDNIDVAGVPTTAGSAAFRDNVPTQDAEVISRLRRAGAVVIGKTAMHEFAYGPTCDNPWFGRTYNPWDSERLPGASSGGSGVALAADLCVGALGSDTGGSIRGPASFNGVVGLRPTLGAISNRGLIPLSWNLDTIGPMARQVADVAALYAVMVGHDAHDPHSAEPPLQGPSATSTVGEGVAGLRIGLPRSFFYDELEEEVSRLVDGAIQVFKDLGASVRDVDLSGARDIGPAALTITQTDALAVHQTLLENQPELIGADVRRRLAVGRNHSGLDYASSMQLIWLWRNRVQALFQSNDLLLVPTTPCVAPPIADVEKSKDFRMGGLTLPWSAAGTPALSVPGGFTPSGLPAGIQLVAAPWREAILFRAGVAYQAATDWHQRRPSLPMTRN